MLRTVLWIAAACVAVLVALAVSRSLNFDRAPEKALEPPVVAEPIPAPPAPVVEPVVPPAPPPPPPMPDEQQIQDDAAATGMTTVEPEPPLPTEPPAN